MSKRLILGIVLAVVASAITAGAVVVVGQGGGSGGGEYGTLYIDAGPLTGNTADSYGTIDTCIGDLTVGIPFDIDIIIDGGNDLAGAYWILYYNKDVLKVTGYNWANWKMGGGGLNFTDAVPDSDGAFASTYAQASGVNGDGVLQRVTLEPVADGPSDLKLCTVAGECPDAADSFGRDHQYPKVLVDDPAGEVRVVVGGPCPTGGEGGGAESPTLVSSLAPAAGGEVEEVRWGSITVSIPADSDMGYSRLSSAPEAIARGIMGPVVLLGMDESLLIIDAQTGQVVYDDVLPGDRAAFDAVLATVQVVEAEVVAEPGAPWPYGSTLPDTPRKQWDSISFLPPDARAGISVHPVDVDAVGPGPPWGGLYVNVSNSRSQMWVTWYGVVLLTGGGELTLAEFVEADPSLLTGIHPDDRQAFQRFARTIEISPLPTPIPGRAGQTP